MPGYKTWLGLPGTSEGTCSKAAGALPLKAELSIKESSAGAGSKIHKVSDLPKS